jgi:very-short-patch-repair endonuclease
MAAIPVPLCAAAQAGVFTRQQAYAAGWTPRQVKRRLATGAWLLVAGRGLGSTELAVGHWQLAFATHLTWPDAVISHEVAGALWAFPIDPARLGTTQIGTATVAPHVKVSGSNLRALRRRLPRGHVDTLRGLPVTSELRTAADLLADLPWDRARKLFAWLSTRGVMDRRELQFWTDHRPGMSGTAQLRRLLRVSAGGSLSAAEDVLHDLLRRAAITGWTANARIAVHGRVIAVADVLFATERVIVEVDGWSTHRSAQAFQRDRSTQNALVTAGYVVLRFTWADLTGDPANVVRTVRRAIGR